MVQAMIVWEVCNVLQNVIEERFRLRGVDFTLFLKRVFFYLSCEGLAVADVCLQKIGFLGRLLGDSYITCQIVSMGDKCVLENDSVASMQYIPESHGRERESETGVGGCSLFELCCICLSCEGLAVAYVCCQKIDFTKRNM